MSDTKVLTWQELDSAMADSEQWVRTQKSEYFDDLDEQAWGEVTVTSLHKTLGIVVKYTSSFNFYFETDENYAFFDVGTEGLDPDHILKMDGFVLADEDDVGFFNIPFDFKRVDVGDLIETIRREFGNDAADDSVSVRYSDPIFSNFIGG